MKSIVYNDINMNIYDFLDLFIVFLVSIISITGGIIFAISSMYFYYYKLLGKDKNSGRDKYLNFFPIKIEFVYFGRILAIIIFSIIIFFFLPIITLSGGSESLEVIVFRQLSQLELLTFEINLFIITIIIICIDYYIYLTRSRLVVGYRAGLLVLFSLVYFINSGSIFVIITYCNSLLFLLLMVFINIFITFRLRQAYK